MPDTHTTPSLLRQWREDPEAYRLTPEEARRRALLRWPHLFDPGLIERLTPTVWLDTSEDEPVQPVKQTRKRKPTLAGVARQAARAGIEVAGYEVRPDGVIKIITGKPVGGIDTDAASPDPRWN